MERAVHTGSDRLRPSAAGVTSRPTYETGSDPAPVIGGLRGFYEWMVPLSWPVVRLAVGWNFVVHGWGKIMAGADKVAPQFAEMGFTNPHFLAVFSTYIEFIGGLGLILGLFTRFWAAALAIELGYIAFDLYWGNGFSWLRRGYEYTLLWGAVSFAIALRGGGPYSVDRRLGREL